MRLCGEHGYLVGHPGREVEVLPPQAFCSICGGPYTLRKDGTVRAHKRFKGGGKYGSGSLWERCPGSGQPPKWLAP